MTAKNTTGSWLAPDRVRMIKYGFLIALGIASTAYHLWFTQLFPFEQDQHKIAHLGFMLVGAAVLAFEPEPETRRERLGNYATLLEAALSVVVAVYLFTAFNRIVYEQLGIYTHLDLFMGLLIILLLLDVCRRVYGPMLSLVGVVGLAYALFGPYFPGILNHNGVQAERLVQGLTVEFGSGVFGVIVEVSGTFIIIFMILAGLLEAYGALEYFVQVGTLIGKRVRSGLAQMTTVASMGMGSVNGSAAANAATTGAFTIPLLKRHGLDRDTAAAYEAVASSGGQIMPPIMGAAAFIMAEITGMSYLKIIVVGFLPALLFYGTVAIGVHLTTIKEGLTSEVNEEELTEVETVDEDRKNALNRIFGRTTTAVSFGQISVRNLIVEGLALWVPLVVLLYALVVLMYDPLYAGFLSIMSAFPAAFVQGIFFRDGYGSRDFFVDTMDGLGRGMENAAPIAVSLGVMNIFVGVLNLTGFTQVFASSLVELSGGVLALLLMFAMVAALLFGLGMPTVAAYITAVLLIAPALTEAGIDLLAAHFFVFYFAILSALTPPVAIACLVTARVAGGNFWRTAGKSLVLGAPLFVLPYVFVVNDSLLFWSAPATPITFVVVGVALVATVTAIVNYFSGQLRLPNRAGLLVAAGAAMFAPLVPMTVAVQAVATLTILALLYIEVKYGSESETGQPEQAAVDD
ncbi:TRAP transporter permease [Haloarcula argentinensis]|nr:C4-dicarboxylate anaerobic carrier [Haloarcula argentinensis DSM 12282]